ncbi:Immunoglobulin superfamily member 10 [Holothuria leucospilota]|uniref:Immunoglobulin superfamily member 10 n=1 Tax=Holothuria leucospilota TaxID=206669 RepID=A0A9Q1CL88_HOLLE|nr:Immunoglobulin superfamily member 10 [Holothuria leucospilota]
MTTVSSSEIMCYMLTVVFRLNERIMEKQFHLRFYGFTWFFLCVLIVNIPTRAYNIFAQSGETINVKCVIEAPVGSLTHIIWFHRRRELLIHSSSIEDDTTRRHYPVLPLENSIAILKIRNVTFQDAGVYSCVKYLKEGIPANHSTSLQVRSSPLIKMAINNATENEYVFSMCCADFALKPEDATISWSIGGETISNDSCLVLGRSPEYPNTYTFCSNVTLKSNRTHSGKLLECSLLGGINSSTRILLNILYSPRIKMEGILLKKRQTIFADKNDIVNISCILEGNPRPEVHLEKKVSSNMWTKLPVKPWTTESNDDTSIIYTFMMYLLSQEDTGTFRFIASNGVGPEIVSSHIHLKFKNAVTVNIVMLSPKNLFLEDNVYVSCIAQGTPYPEVHLQKLVNEDQWVKLSVEPEISYGNSFFNFTFSFKNVKSDTGGVYRCYAYNEICSNATSNTLTIEISVLQNILQTFLRNIPLFTILCLGFVVLIMAISIRTIYKRVWHGYDVAAAAALRNLSTREPEVRQSSYESVPDVCRSLPPLPQSRGNPSSSNLQDNDGYQELRRESFSTVGYDSALHTETTSCVVKYHVLEGP